MAAMVVVAVTPGRYVVLHHTGHGAAHFDLMLAMDDVSDLLTWRCPAWPPTAADGLTPLPAHRRDYLTYEGAVSGDRGEVRRVVAGHFQWVGEDETSMTIEIGGRRLSLPRPA